MTSLLLCLNSCKVKHDFQLANKEISPGNVYMIQKCFTLFDRTSCLTVICLQYSERICCTFISILKLDRNVFKIHTRNNKNTTICFNWKEAIWSLTKKKKKKTRKKVKQNHYTWRWKWQDLNPRNFRFRIFLTPRKHARHPTRQSR